MLDESAHFFNDVIDMGIVEYNLVEKILRFAVDIRNLSFVICLLAGDTLNDQSKFVKVSTNLITAFFTLLLS